MSDEDLRTVLDALTSDEISMATKIYESAKELEDTLMQAENVSVSSDWFKKIESLELRVGGALSEAIRMEIAALDKISRA